MNETCQSDVSKLGEEFRKCGKPADTYQRGQWYCEEHDPVNRRQQLSKVAARVRARERTK